MKFTHLPFAAVLLLFLGCDKKEPIPAYLDVQSIDVQGFTDQKIVSAWVYADNQFLGAFPLPAKIPVLKSGTSEIVVFAGIIENGDYGTPNFYPLFTSWKADVALVAGQATAIQPTVKYNSTATIAAFGFEADDPVNWFTEDIDTDPATHFATDATTAFTGSVSGKATIDTAHQILEAYSIQFPDLPTGGTQPCWLEISYKTDFSFRVGLAGSATATGLDEAFYFQTINKKADWAKMYINLNQALNGSKYKFFKLAFYAKLPVDGNGNPTIISGNLWLDDLRLVYQK